MDNILKSFENLTPEELENEKSAVINWLIEGAERVKRQGGFSNNFNPEKMTSSQKRKFKRANLLLQKLFQQ